MRQFQQGEAVLDGGAGGGDDLVGLLLSGVSGDGRSAMAEPVGQSVPSMMRKSRSTQPERTTSACW
jgi:hypothetical protein